MNNEPAYSVEREFDIPVEILWAAWTDPVALEAWYHGVGMASVPGSVQSEAEVGGAWSVAIGVPDFEFVAYFYGEYTAVIDQARLEHTMFYTQSVDEFNAKDITLEHHNIRIEFEAKDFRSWVKYSQFGDLPETEALQAQAGIESYFDSLSDYLSIKD
jgi:uncharacterized protein YndB with AHSA1/START domain